MTIMNSNMHMVYIYIRTDFFKTKSQILIGHRDIRMFTGNSNLSFVFSFNSFLSFWINFLGDHLFDRHVLNIHYLQSHWARSKMDIIRIHVISRCDKTCISFWNNHVVCSKCCMKRDVHGCCRSSDRRGVTHAVRSRGLRTRFVEEGTFEQWSEGLGHVDMLRVVGGMTFHSQGTSGCAKAWRLATWYLNLIRAPSSQTVEKRMLLND